MSPCKFANFQIKINVVTHLNAVVVEIRNDDMPLRVDGDVVRPGQVVRLAAARPELGEEFPVELGAIV